MVMILSMRNSPFTFLLGIPFERQLWWWEKTSAWF
jgi:hypothetical protein